MIIGIQPISVRKAKDVNMGIAPVTFSSAANGDGSNRLLPQDLLTFGEAAVVIYNILTQAELINK